jgi:hypothetical protein
MAMQGDRMMKLRTPEDILEYDKLKAENKRLREVIEKLKNPTRLMWAAGGDSIVQSRHTRSIKLHHDEVIKLVWFPMLEEALKEIK